MILKNTSTLFLIIILSLLFFDLGNVDAIRQGTEGFYLLISKEMYQLGSFLTPFVYGEPHWSKPPLQFWMAMPFYKITGESFLLSARLSILIFSLLNITVISHWYQNTLKRNWFEAFFFLMIPLYFIKYSRIYMMEMTLTYLSVISVLFYYNYVERRKTKHLIFACLFAGASVLIKGPVSLAMIFPGTFLYSLYRNKKNIIPFLYFCLLSVFISSIWFLAATYKHGLEFLNYFFIRENLGKFTAKNYPVSSVIQGLFLYSAPLCFFLIPILKNKSSALIKKPINIYLILSFCFFFFLWFLPKQKSHHYAVPSIPLLILFISYNFFQLQPKIKQRAFNYLIAFFNCLFIFGFILIAILYYFKDTLAPHNMNIYFLGCFFILSLWTYLAKQRLPVLRLARFILPGIFFFQFLMPLAVLPVIPQKISLIINQAKDKQYFVSYRKPFFMFEAMEREGKIISRKLLKDERINKGDFVVLTKALYDQQSHDSYILIKSWPTWKRGVGIDAFSQAIKQKNLKLIQDTYILVQKNET